MVLVLVMVVVVVLVVSGGIHNGGGGFTLRCVSHSYSRVVVLVVMEVMIFT